MHGTGLKSSKSFMFSFHVAYATGTPSNENEFEYSSWLTSNFGFVIWPLPDSIFVIIKTLSTPPRPFSAHV